MTVPPSDARRRYPAAAVVPIVASSIQKCKYFFTYFKICIAGQHISANFIYFCRISFFSFISLAYFTQNCYTVARKKNTTKGGDQFETYLFIRSLDERPSRPRRERQPGEDHRVEDPPCAQQKRRSFQAAHHLRFSHLARHHLRRHHPDGACQRTEDVPAARTC